MIRPSVEPAIRTVIKSLPKNEIDDLVQIREFFRQTYLLRSLRGARPKRHHQSFPYLYDEG